mgnify:CR=1 FL=1|jgi:hypothetical protein
MSDTLEESLFLELGDIIRINAPTNEDINEHVFFIDYIDKDEIDIIDDVNLVQINLKLTNGQFNDKSIESIELLSRSEKKGYARQNNLIPGKMITLRFGGNVPVTINGTITDLEEDMIEIKIYPTNKLIYIDFAYNGIPKSLPLESIQKFVIPETIDIAEQDIIVQHTTEEEKQDETDDLSIIEEEDEIPELSMSPEGEQDEELEFDMIVPIANVKDRLKRMIIDADDIQIGKNLGSITEEVPVDETARRFGIETQANDLLDELLSTIPSSQRTSKVLNNIHLMIERFKQLRSQFSIISSEGEIIKQKTKGADYKPLVESLKNFNKNLHWLLPIAKNRKKLYNIVDEDDEDDDTSENDIIPVSLKNIQISIQEYTDQYKENRVPDGINKYKYLYKELNKLYTPFGLPTDTTDVITEQRVNDNFNIIIDNLGDFYSSISKGKNNIVDKKRFLIERYNTGLTELEVDNKAKKTGYNPKRITLTQNDKTAVSGIMTLEEPALLYSHINLPNSSILLKSHLSLVTFNFWSILKKNRKIVTTDVEIDENINLEESLFLKNINAFLFKESMKFTDRHSDSFKIFLNKVIPRTRRLFTMVKKYIKNTPSYLKIVEYMEPFLVYPDDITFKQYEIILEFLREQISLFKKNLVQSEINSNSYISNKFSTTKVNDMLNILNINDISLDEEDIKSKNAIDEYQMNDLTTSEAVREIILMDCGKLYCSIISETDINLYQPIDIDELIKQEMERKPEEKEANKSCQQFVMAKKYIDIEELREDDGDIIYFDKKYDPTRYDIIEEFKQEQEIQLPNDFKIFLINHLMHTAGLSPAAAQVEAASIIQGQREVQPGEYAYLLDDNYKPVYFYRDDNRVWIKNEELSGKELNEIMFCNLKNSCISIKKKCGPIEINKKQIQKNLYKEILSYFDKQFHSSIEKLKKSIIENYDYNFKNARRLRYLKMVLSKKNQTNREKIAKTLQERDIITSPYEGLRNKILSQQDFIKKQKDIIAFCNKYTRTSLDDNPNENKYWLYCTDTSIPLIPSFYKRLADAFYIGSYKSILERVKTERGKSSDDGDKVVDRFSGYIICKIDYDESEGYDEQGRKVVSKELLEEDIENIVANLDISHGEKSKASIMIDNVISTMDKHLGISVKSELEFIHNNVNTILSKYLPSKKVYDRAMIVKQAGHKKRKLPSYEKAYNNALMMSTLSTYLVVIQTMMPSIKTKTTFPTCNRSFQGFPLDGDGDTSGLQYIVCAAINIARGSDTKPWTSLPKIRKKIGQTETINKYVTTLKSFIDSKIITNSDVLKRISDKLYYLKHNVEEEERIPEEFDVKNWSTFLPPLRPIRVSNMHNISTSFKSDLNRMLSSGDPYQFEKLSDLNSKIFYFSLHIQELIQRVVNKKNIQLFSLTNEPFIENYCCNDGSKHTLQYFINIEPNITKFNENVGTQSDLLTYALDLIKPSFIFDPLNTRLIFPPVAKNFSEEIIYKTFIKFCKFNSGVILSNDLEAICGMNSSEFNKHNTLEEKIKIMKHEGKNYSTASFYQLLNVINLKNIVFVDFNPIIITGRLQVEHLLSNSILQQNVIDTPLKKIIDTLKDLFDSFESTRDKNDSDIRNANTFIDEQLDVLLNYNILPFLSKYGDVDDEYISFIKSVEKFKTRGDDIYISRDDETAFAESEFLKAAIINILKVFPSIIINNVDYKNVNIPKHWKLAPSHKIDVLDIVESEFLPLQDFYSDKQMISLLKNILNKSQDLLKIINATPFYANIKEKPGEKRNNTLLNGKLLEKFMKFYFLYAINIYIKYVEDNEQQSSETKSENLSSDVIKNIISGRNIGVKERLSQLIIAYLKILMSHKKILNFSDIEVKESVIRAAEREKSKMVDDLGKLSQEELQVEDILKNQKLGKWSVGLTKAIYEYDQGQYEKERSDFEADAKILMNLNNLPSEEHNAALLDMIDECVHENRRIEESNVIMQQMGDDDDFGNLDGDESF